MRRRSVGVERRKGAHGDEVEDPADEQLGAVALRNRDGDTTDDEEWPDRDGQSESVDGGLDW